MAAPMRRNIGTISQYFLGRSIPFRHLSVWCQLRRYSKETTAGVSGGQSQDDQTKPDNYVDMMESRLDQAAHSLLVKVPSGATLDQVLQYMNDEAGSVANCFPHSQKGQSQYALVEFNDEKSLSKLHTKAQDRHFLKLNTNELGNMKIGVHGASWPEINKAVSDIELVETLNKAESISEQLKIFHENQKLQEPEIRLRFLLCMLLENAFQNMLPECHVYPFGSSVNGFGKRNCDVDMYVDRGLPKGIVPVRKRKTNSFDLSYNQKAMSSERAGTQITLQTMSSYLRQNNPHCSRVFDILHAMCPLIKFQHITTGLSCDLTADNRLGLTSSELLYVYCHLDVRVPQLVFLVRHWARAHKITHTAPGYWITNFPLTLLVIYFLQTRTPAVVPSLDYLCSIAGKEEKRIVNGINTTFVGDLSKVATTTNVQSVENLLQEFFHFCATFDFSNRALSIRQGDWYKNPDPEQFSLYIENPFETHLNTCKNVKTKLVDVIRDSSRLALDKMSRTDFNTPVESSSPGHIWGIPLLFHMQDDNHSRLSSILHIISDDDKLDSTTGVEVSEPGHELNDVNDHMTDHVTDDGSGGITAESRGSDEVAGHVADHVVDHVVDHVIDHVTDDRSSGITAESRTDEVAANNSNIVTLKKTLESFPKSIDRRMCTDSTQHPDKVSDEDQKPSMADDLRLETGGKSTQLVQMYASKHDMKVTYTFSEENLSKTNTKRTFTAECQLGEWKTNGKASTKKTAKHQAARFMIRNLRGDFIERKLKNILK